MVQNLIPDDATHLEALLAGYRIDDDVAVYTDKVLGVEDGVFILAEGFKSAKRRLFATRMRICDKAS